MYLFKHKVLIAALFSCLCVPFNGFELLFNFLTVEVIELNLALGESCKLMVANVINVSCIFKNSRNVRRKICFSVRHTDYHRAVLSCNIDLSGVGIKHNCQSIRASDSYKCMIKSIYRGTEILFIIVVNKLDSYLGIGCGVEGVALLGELCTQLLIVLDDTVVNTDNISVIRVVRVSVSFVRLSVSCPSCMADTAGTVYGITLIGHFSEHLQLAHSLYYFSLAVAVSYSDTCRVIASVFKLCKSVQKNGGCLLASCKSNYSAHNVLSFRITGGRYLKIDTYIIPQIR